MLEDLRHSHNLELLELINAQKDLEKDRQSQLSECKDKEKKQKMILQFDEEKVNDKKQIQTKTKQQTKILEGQAKKHFINLSKDLS